MEISREQNLFDKFSWLLIFSYLVYAVVYMFIGEKVPVNNGFGFDGFIYGNGVINFPEKLLNKEFLNAHVERLLPSALLYYFFTITGIEFSHEYIIQGFQVINIISIVFSAVLWKKIALVKSFNPSLELFGLIAILITFPALKVIPYYPVLTDGVALLIGFLALYGFVAHKNGYIVLAFLLAAFTWPIATLTLPFLLTFNRKLKFEFSGYQKLNVVFCVLALIVLNGLIYYFFIIRNNLSDNYPAYRLSAPGKWDIPNLIIGTLYLNAYLFFCFRFLLKMNITDNFKIVFRSLNYKYLILFFSLIIVFKMFAGSFPDAGYVKLSWYVIDLFTSLPLQPGSNLVCLILYFGPVMYFAIFNWNKLIESVKESGIGFMIFFTANLVQCLDAESRHLIFFIPYIIFLVITTMGKVELKYTFLIVFAGLSLLLSKIWFVINSEEFVFSILNEPIYSNEVQQRYLMHFGRFMSYKYYLIQVPFVVAFGVLCYWLRSKIGKLQSLNIKPGQKQ